MLDRLGQRNCPLKRFLKARHHPPLHYVGFAAGNVIEYVIRYEEKGGVVDLEKTRWYLDRLIDGHG